MEKEAIRLRIVRGLYNKDKWGGAHEYYISAGIPFHSREDKKNFEEVLKELVDIGWLLVHASKRTGKGSGIHYSLNPQKKGEIERFLEENIGK